jgi:hypothetical protein
MNKTAQKLIDTLQAAGAEELYAIDQQIEAMESELEALVSEKRKGIDALKRLRAVLDVQVNGRQPKAKRAKPQKQSRQVEGGTVLERIYDYLSKQGEPVKPALLADAIGCSKAAIYAAIDHEWFAKTPDGIEIARAA